MTTDPAPEEQSDEALMEAFARRSCRESYERLARRWENRMYWFLAKATGNPEDALDLRQEVFVRMWRYGAGFRGDGCFATWIYRIAVNATNDWRRNRGRRPALSLDRLRDEEGFDAPDAGKGPGEFAAEAERSRDLQQALAALPLEDRRLLLLRFEEGHRYRQIGEILNIPETTLKSRVCRLLAHLRRQMDAREERTAADGQQESAASAAR